MKKTILYTIISAAVLFCAPTQAKAEGFFDDQVEQQMNQPKITVERNIVQVQNANGKFLIVYDLTGKMVKRIKIEGDDRKYDLSLEPGACYIIKVDRMVRKVAISKV